MTIAELKRKLTKGTKMTLVYANREHKFLNVPRYVVKTNTQGVCLSSDRDAVKGSYLDYPRASLSDFDGITLTIYGAGVRELTEAEKRAIETAPSKLPQNKEAVWHEAMTDGSSFYYKDKAHFQSLGMEYLRGHETVRGLRFDFNTKKVIDETIKGEKELEYIIG